MKKDKVITVILLAISVALFVSIWGTFHNIVGVQRGWIAFISAAVFFAAGHKIEESVNVALSHLLGIGWGLAVLYLFSVSIVSIDSILYSVLTLATFGFMSVIVTNMGIKFLSHTPSLFSGWAIAFAVFGGISVTN
ncbi:MAG: DUF1097 domain-containing protein [Campylobacteraceae bacterium]|nr:DUF1097 domain-containing protein [Campylobacteraceae bacterium]